MQALEETGGRPKEKSVALNDVLIDELRDIEAKRQGAGSTQETKDRQGRIFREEKQGRRG